MVLAGDDACTYLTDQDRCRIYLNRPKVCREYTTDHCEYDGEWTFDKVFETPEQIWEYAEAVLPPRRAGAEVGFALPSLRSMSGQLSVDAVVSCQCQLSVLSRGTDGISVDNGPAKRQETSRQSVCTH